MFTVQHTGWATKRDYIVLLTSPLICMIFGTLEECFYLIISVNFIHLILHNL